MFSASLSVCCFEFFLYITMRGRLCLLSVRMDHSNNSLEVFDSAVSSCNVESYITPTIPWKCWSLVVEQLQCGELHHSNNTLEVLESAS